MALLCRAMSALPSRALSAARLPRSHLRVLLAAVVLVLLAHGGLLFGLPPGFGPQPAAGGVVALQVRQILVPRAVPAVTAANPAPRRPSAAPAAARRPAPAGRAVDTAVDPGAPARPQEEAAAPEAETPGRGEAASEEVLMRTDEAGRPLDPALPLPEPLPQAAPDAPAASPAGELRVPRQGGGDTPVYPTRMPAAATLHYDLLRGVLAGQARLDWQPAAQGYEARVEGLLFGMPVVAWHSQGGFDSNGIAPERFTDRRRSRDLRAANFLREAGRITFSGPPVEFPLLPGSQDRLSWMVQLAAIVEADPALRTPGTRITMFVAGARGDADLWTFTVRAVEPVDVVGATLPATVALEREPRKPYDTQVHVWLDPARQHLPARLRLTTLPGRDAIEFVLRP